jgi:hypothetical protein
VEYAMQTTRKTTKYSSLKALCEDWFNKIKSFDNDWGFLRNAGLCGSGPPRGVILRFVLEHIGTYYAPDDALLLLVNHLRGVLGSSEGGFDGNLLEMATILEYKKGNSLPCVLLAKENNKWTPGVSRTLLGEKPTVWTYDEAQKKLAGVYHTGWHLLLLPTGFCVFDLLLVCVGDDAVEVFGVQITVSPKPFLHPTQETCGELSKARVVALQNAVQDEFKTDAEIVYVMLAPKAAENSFVAPGQQAPYYFAPPEKAGVAAPAKKAKKRKADKCCGCGKGGCKNKNCGCVSRGDVCITCSASPCYNRPKAAKKAKK